MKPPPNPSQASEHDDLGPEQASRGITALTSFAVSLLQQQSLEDLLWSMAERIGVLLGFEDCVIYLLVGDELVQYAAYGVKNTRGREIFEPITVRVDEGVVGRVAVSGKAALINDVRDEPDYIPDQFPGLSELAVPLIFEDRVIGVIDTEASSAFA